MEPCSTSTPTNGPGVGVYWHSRATTQTELLAGLLLWAITVQLPAMSAKAGAIALMGTIGSVWLLRPDGTLLDVDADERARRGCVLALPRHDPDRVVGGVVALGDHGAVAGHVGEGRRDRLDGHHRLRLAATPRWNLARRRRRRTGPAWVCTGTPAPRPRPSCWRGCCSGRSRCSCRPCRRRQARSP